MTEDSLTESIELLIKRIGDIDSIGSGGLTGAMYPDDMITSLHNHLGNIKHLTDDSKAAFNATDQHLSIVAAYKELGELGDNLMSLHLGNIISNAQYEHLARSIHDVAEHLKKASDPDYS